MGLATLIGQSGEPEVRGELQDLLVTRPGTEAKPETTNSLKDPLMVSEPPDTSGSFTALQRGTQEKTPNS